MQQKCSSSVKDKTVRGSISNQLWYTSDFSMKEQIIDYIQMEFISEDGQELRIDDDLLGSGILDSLGSMKLIAFFTELMNLFFVVLSLENQGNQNDLKKFLSLYAKGMKT